MSISTSILFHHIHGLSQRAKPRLEAAFGRAVDEAAIRPAMLSAVAAKAILRLSEDEALDCLVDGVGVDGMALGPIRGRDFAVHLFRGRFAEDDRDGAFAFPHELVEKAARAARTLLDPETPMPLSGPSAERVTELRHRILAGCIPHFRFHFASNGQPWDAKLAAGMPTGYPAARFEHYGPDELFHLLGSPRPVTTSLRFTGKSVVDELDRARVFFGRMSVGDLARLVDAHRKELIDRDVSHFLDPDADWTHESICRTLESQGDRHNFYFYNQGVTLGCDRFLGSQQTENREVRVERLRVLDGLKTCRAVHDAVARRGDWAPNDAFLMVRLYEIPFADGEGVIPGEKPHLASFMPSN